MLGSAGMKQPSLGYAPCAHLRIYLYGRGYSRSC